MKRITLIIMAILMNLVTGSVFLYAQTATESWVRIGLYSGDITAMAISPNYENDKTIYIGVRKSGLWRSSNRGETWSQCGAVPCDYTVSGIALGRDYDYGGSDSDACFAITEEAYLYRSTDDFQTCGYSKYFEAPGTIPVPAPLTAIVLDGLTSFNSTTGNVYVGTNGAGVYAHLNGGGSDNWDYIGPDGMKYCTSLTITSEATQAVWATFKNYSGMCIQKYSGSGVIWSGYGSALTGKGALSIRAAWTNPSGYNYLWVGTTNQGMWYSSDNGSTWQVACDGVSVGTVNFEVKAMRECPAFATDYEMWEGRSDGLRTSSSEGTSCSDGFPRSKVNCMEFAPGFDTGGTNCDAFVGTDRSLYRIPCAGSTKSKTPMITDGKSVAVAEYGKGFFMGSLTGGLYKSVDSHTMIQYNGFPDNKTPQIVSVCLHPLYNEQDTCGDANTLFVAANFTTSGDNGIYKSIDAGNSWTKVDSATTSWPTSTVLVRDLAVSPNYGSDGTLFAATSLGVYKWAYDLKDSRFEWNEVSTPYFTDTSWVAVTPTYNDNGSCSYNNGTSNFPGFPCNTLFAGGYDSTAGHVLLWYSLNGGGQWIPVYISNAWCTSNPTYCPIDVTGIAFPKNFGSSTSPQSIKFFISSSSKGIMRSYAGTTTLWLSYCQSRNSGIPATLNVVDIASDPDWVDDSTSPVDPIILCAVASGSTSSPDTYAGVYGTTTASNSTPTWTLRKNGHAASVAFETRKVLSSHDLAMAGFVRDAKISTSSIYGAYLSDDSGGSFQEFTGYYSLPNDVFSTVAHERDPNYIFATSPSMGVFVSSNKGESFRPYNVGAGSTSGPCYLKNAYGITMLQDRRASYTDAIYVGTQEGIKARYIYYDTTTGIDLDHSDSYETPSSWRNSTWASGGTAITGYWERLEVVPSTTTTMPVWAVSPYRAGYSGSSQGFAQLPVGSYDGWVLQNNGVVGSTPNAKGVRTGYDGSNDSAKLLSSGQIIEGSVPYHVWDYYYITVTASNDDLQVLLEDPDLTSDPDLYVRYGALPTESSYDYRPWHDGNETVCVTSILNEDFNSIWGTYGDNPPAGWTISSNESPVTWNTDNWYKYSSRARVNGATARLTQNETLVSVPFNLPSSLTSAGIKFYQLFNKPSGTTTYGRIWINSTENPTLELLDTQSADMTFLTSKTITFPSKWLANTNIKIYFQFYDSSSADGRYWIIENFDVWGSTPYRLRQGTWYIGVYGYANANSSYKLTATLDTGCTQTFAQQYSDRKQPEGDVRFVPPDPKAPMAGSTWGTVNGMGVVKGTASGATVNFESRGGCSNAQTIMQLPDLTLICGCSDGIVYSPAPDEGATTWLSPDAVASEGSANYVDVIQASNGDVLIAADGTGTGTEAGGVWLSGDKGKHWMRIAQGFDSSSQGLSDLVVDNGSTPSYYASTDDTGLYTRSVTASAYPNVTGISPNNGPSTGNTTVTITGSGFSSGCPTGTASDCPDTAPIVLFGDTEVAGSWTSTSSISCTSPPHTSGLVAVKVRNPDTRESAAGMGFTFNYTCQTPSGMANNTATDLDACSDTGVKIDWTAPSSWGDEEQGTRTYDILRDAVAIASGRPEGTLTYTDLTGVNGTSYVYSVKANNGCGLSCTTAGTAATDSINVSAPTISSVTDVSACAQSGVTITWGAVSGATTYDLYVDGATIVSNVASPYLRNPGDTSSHNYQVRGRKASCTGPWSSVVAGTDVNSAVGAPTISSVTDVSACAQSGVTITWGAVSGATGYDLYVDSTTLITTVTSPYLRNPGDTSSHNYQVRAKNASCTGSWSTAVAGTDVNSAVAAPTISSVTDVSACAQSGVTITWGSVSGATGYDLYVDSTTLITTVTSPYLRNPGDTSSHSYQVRAKNASCTGSWSATVAGTDVNNAVGATTISSVVDADACAQSGVTITWGAVSGATGYDLYVDSATIITTVTSPYLRNPGDTSSHSYQVRAKNASCTGSWSTVVTGTDVNNSVGTPTISSVVDADACAQSGVTITWGAVSGATGYDLYVDSATIITTVTSPYLRNPGDTSSHSYQVRAKNASCTGSWSGAVAGTDVNNSVGTPTISSVVDADACAQSGVTITWGAVSGATGYDLYVDSATLITTVTSPYLRNPGDTSSHSYQVRAKNASCTGSWSTAVAGTDVNNSVGTPTINSVVDADACAQSGVTITWGAVSGATGYDLYVDSTTIIAGVTSPYLRNPGDTSSHNYQVRAKNVSCTGSWSAAVAGTDINNGVGTPTISSVVDADACAQSGVTITWGAVSGATGYDLYVDSTTIIAGATSPYLRNPGDTSSHSYQVRAKNASCTGSWSAAVAGTDANGGVAAPDTPTVTDVDHCEPSGVQITWGAVSGATGYDLYVDSATIINGVTSPYIRNPGDTASHNYQVRAVNASCTGAWSTIAAGTDVDDVCGCTAPAAEVTGELWSTDKGTFYWPASGSDNYRVIRGVKADLPNLLTSANDGCVSYSGSSINITNVADDDPQAEAGRFYWYLVQGYNGTDPNTTTCMGPAGASRDVTWDGTTTCP